MENIKIKCISCKKNFIDDDLYIGIFKENDVCVHCYNIFADEFVQKIENYKNFKKYIEN